MALPDLMDTIKFSNIPEFVAHIDKLIAGTKPTPDVTRITTNGKMERRHRTPQLKTIQMSILLFLCATSSLLFVSSSVTPHVQFVRQTSWKQNNRGKNPIPLRLVLHLGLL